MGKIIGTVKVVSTGRKPDYLCYLDEEQIASITSSKELWSMQFPGDERKMKFNTLAEAFKMLAFTLIDFDIQYEGGA